MSTETAQNLKILPAHESFSLEAIIEAKMRNSTLAPSKKDERLIDRLDRTYTQVGRLYFDHRLANPISDIQIIQARQEVTQEFINSSLAHILEPLFQELKESEEHILGFFAKRPVEIDSRFLALKFTAGGKELNKRVNQYSAIVSLSAAIKTTESGLSALLKAATVVAMPLYALSLTGLLEESANEVLNEALEEFANRTAITSGVTLGLMQAIGGPTLRAGAAITAAGVTVSSVPATFGYFSANLNVEAYVQNKLVVVARYFRAMEKIYTLLTSIEAISSRLEHFEKLKSFFQNPDLQYLFSLLRSRTFNAKASYLFLRGPVVLVWEYFTREFVITEFEKAFLAIGEIDTFLSVTRLMAESDIEGNCPYCFPKYVENKSGEKPFISVIGLHNPLVPFVPECSEDLIKLGLHSSQNLLLTAPNTSGKSTKIRALAYLAALQGLGIAPAKEVSGSLFDLVISSKGLMDSSQQSLHQSYLNFSNQLLAKLEQSPDKNVLVLLDEAFTTTESKDGASFLKGLLDLLQEKKNAVVLVASHFKELIDNVEGYVHYTIEPSSRKLICGSFKGSNAFQLAEQMEVGHDLLDRARQFRATMEMQS